MGLASRFVKNVTTNSESERPSSQAVSDLYGEGPVDEAVIVEREAERLFEAERQLYHRISVKLGENVAKAIFSRRPTFTRTDAGRERLKKHTLLRTHQMMLVSIPKYKKMSTNARAQYLANWYNNAYNPDLPAPAPGNKGRFLKTTRASVRQLLMRAGKQKLD